MKKTMLRLMLFMLLCIGSAVAFGQAAKTISGSVKDSTGNPLPGVTITVKGTTTSTISDGQGNFRITVPNQNAVLVFSSIGYQNQEVSVGSNNIVNATLQNSANQLNEVVVTGFGARTNTRKLTYSITQVKGDEITKANNANLVNALQGKVAGVFISQGAGGPSSSSRIRIRGNARLDPNTQPLVVIDGILIEPGTTGADSWGSGQDFGNIMKDLNPDDYESITVLKGSAASALYGAKAINGVLLITTKKGHARKGIGVSVTHTESFDNAYKMFDIQNVYGGGLSPNFEKDAQGNDLVPQDASIYVGGYSYGPKFDGRMVKDLDGRIVPWVANNPLDFFQTGKYVNTNVAMEGGNENSTFRFSYSNLYNTSVQPNNDLKRNSFALRATHKLTKFLSLDASVNYTNSRIKNPILQGGNNSPLFAFVYYMARNAPINYYRNNYIDTALGGRKSGAAKDPYYLANTFWNYFEINKTQSEDNLLANLDITTNITPWLNVLVRGNVNTYNAKFENRQRGSGAGFSGGAYELDNINYKNMRVQALLNVNKELGKDYVLTLSAGGETYRNLGGAIQKSYTDGGLKIPGIYTISNSVNQPKTEINYGAYPTKRLDALYAYGDLTWKNMLTASFSVRNDWSSALTYRDNHGNYSYTYPSLGLAWIFTELPSFKTGNSVLSYGKLRASIGWTGYDANAYATNNTGYYGLTGSFNNAANGNQSVYTFNGNTLGNQNLKNELAREIEVGGEFRFLNNRLGLDVAYYKKNSFNQILDLSTASESGISSTTVNAGNIQNQGIELLLTATPIKTRNFNWNATVTFTRNKNKILELVPGTTQKSLELAFGADVQAYAVVGQEYGTVITGYAFATYQARDAEGKPIDNVNNGKRVIGGAPYGTTGNYYTFMRSQDYDGTQKTLGNIMEKFMIGTIQQLSYKDFNLSFQIDGKIGGLMASATHQYGSAAGSLANSLYGRDAASGGIAFTDANGVQRNDGIIPDGVLNDGIKATDAQGNVVDLGGMLYADAVAKGYLTPIPAYAYYENLSQWSSGIREYSIFENSFVALREVSLGYNLPSKFSQRIKLNSLRVSVTGRNLGYLYKTAKDGINPEGFYTNRASGFAEYGGLPYVRSLGFTVNATF